MDISQVDELTDFGRMERITTWLCTQGNMWNTNLDPLVHFLELQFIKLNAEKVACDVFFFSTREALMLQSIAWCQILFSARCLYRAC